MSTTANKELTPENFLTEQMVVASAGETKNLTIPFYGVTGGHSSPLASFALTPDFLKTLRQEGFDSSEKTNGIVILDSGVESIAGGQRWELKRERGPMQLEARVRLVFNEESKAVKMFPFLSCNFAWAIHQPSQDRMLGVVVNHFQENQVPDLLREFTQNNCRLAVSLEEINLTGIKRVKQLFRECFSTAFEHDDKPLVLRLSSDMLNPFRPNPDYYSSLLVPQSLQGDLAYQWANQLIRYIHQLSDSFSKKDNPSSQA